MRKSIVAISSIAVLCGSTALSPVQAATSDWRASGKNVVATLTITSTKASFGVTVSSLKPGAKVTIALRSGSCRAKGSSVLTLQGMADAKGVASKGAALTTTQVRNLGSAKSVNVGSTCFDFVQQGASVDPKQTSSTSGGSGDAVGLTAVDKELAACPKNLSGILTSALLDPNYLSALVPLGNVNPPGHTSPVDHIYFQTTSLERTTMFAPAKSVIASAVSIENLEADGKYYMDSWVITYAICRGVALDIAGYAGLTDEVTKAITRTKGNCKEIPQKPEHTELGNRQCGYEVNVPVAAGQIVGWTIAQATADGRITLPVEVFATNRNITPRADVDWTYYGGYDTYYPYAMCLFDLYSGTLKDAFYSKFGLSDRSDNHTGPYVFTPRTVAPKCGTIVQDLTGTLQGMWFNGPPDGTNYEFAGRGLAFLHNNIDPTVAEISIGGTVTAESGVQMFTGQHSGNIDREPSEVKADGTVYCYNLTAGSDKFRGKLLAQLIDDRHTRFERQAGTCSVTEAFKAPLKYQR